MIGLNINYLNQPYANYADNVVTLGTPARWDFELNKSAFSRFGNFCAISLDNDGVQFGGAHPAQHSAYAFALYVAYEYLGLALGRLRQGDVWGYLRYMGRWNAAMTAANEIMLDTRVQPGVQNFVYDGGLFPSKNAHTTVREVAVWRRATSERSWRCK